MVDNRTCCEGLDIGGCGSGSGSGRCSTFFRGKPSSVRPIWDMSTSSDMCRLDDKDDFPVVGSVSHNLESCERYYKMLTYN